MKKTVIPILISSAGITVSRPISEYESLLLPYGFIRVHQSWLINTAKNGQLQEKRGRLPVDGESNAGACEQRRHLLKEP